MLAPSSPSGRVTLPHSSFTQSVRVTCFSVVASSDPSVLPRILDLIAMLDLIPDQCHVSHEDQGGERVLIIDLQLAELRDDDAHRIQKKLEGMVLVTQILCSEKRRAAA